MISYYFLILSKFMILTAFKIGMLNIIWALGLLGLRNNKGADQPAHHI